jgi:hypothetical protein
MAKKQAGGAERARSREAEVATALAKLLTDFPSATESERALLEQMAAEIVRSRRARAIGRAREAADAARLISRFAGQLGLRRDQRPGQREAPGQSLAQYLASRAAASPFAQPAAEADKAPAPEKTPHGPNLSDDEAPEAPA